MERTITDLFISIRIRADGTVQVVIDGVGDREFASVAAAAEWLAVLSTIALALSKQVAK